MPASFNVALMQSLILDEMVAAMASKRALRKWEMWVRVREPLE
jgi:hypothetical protein